jgi:hypothetical protein
MECTETPVLLGERQLKHSRSNAPAWEPVGGDQRVMSFFTSNKFATTVNVARLATGKARFVGAFAL